ncbi:hypothetical protein DFS34DRAFT_113597 [Phlyctochytrium arcticum]|nr:hypothetical protein DFS34DRAFT_469145 [Phlyctochytrium arcticum]KAI9097206.1 hypothetical protein DFS34DRAFT_113597 [Phlyctochytrium arcticum]
MIENMASSNCPHTAFDHHSSTTTTASPMSQNIYTFPTCEASVSSSSSSPSVTLPSNAPPPAESHPLPRPPPMQRSSSLTTTDRILPILFSPARANSNSEVQVSSSLAPPTPTASMDNEKANLNLRAVLDLLVDTIKARTEASLPDTERLFFKRELEKLLRSELSLANKIDGITELADTCLGNGWDSGAEIAEDELEADEDFEDEEKMDESDIPITEDVEGTPFRRRSSANGSETDEHPRKRARLRGSPHSLLNGRRCQSPPSNASGSEQRKEDGRTNSISRMNISCNVKHSEGGFLQQCPEDVLLYIFAHLDARSVCRAVQTCRYWNALITCFDSSTWARLTRTRWGLKEPNSLGMTWKKYFEMHWNVQMGRYRLTRLSEPRTPQTLLPERLSGSGNSSSSGSSSSDRLASISEETVLTSEPSSHRGKRKARSRRRRRTRRRRYVAAWPVDPNNAYIVALDSEDGKLAWVDMEDDPLVIRVANLCHNHLTPYRTLEGHQHTIGLILSNMEGTLVSFDDSSVIIVWNLRTMQFERAINAHKEHGFIFSMNIHKRRIVTGGKNGRVIVWDIDSGDAIWTVDVDSKFLSGLSVQNLLNVAVWEDLVAYGVWEGSFWVGNIKEKRELATFDMSDVRRALLEREERDLLASGSAAHVAPAADTDFSGPASQNGIIPSVTASASSTASHIPPTTEAAPSSSSAPPTPAPHHPITLAQWTTNLVNGGFNLDAAMAQLGGPYSATYNPNAPFPLAPLATPATNATEDPPQVATETTDNTTDEDDNLPDDAAVDDDPWPAFPFPNNNPFDLDETTLFPMTLTLNGHVLLTNGPEPHQLAVWDLCDLKPLYTLTSVVDKKQPSESPTQPTLPLPDSHTTMIPPSPSDPSQPLSDDNPIHRTTTPSPSPPPPSEPDYLPAEIKFAEISRDGSMIFASVFEEPDLTHFSPTSAYRSAKKLLVWDFLPQESTPHRHRVRKFKTIRIGGRGGTGNVSAPDNAPIPANLASDPPTPTAATTDAAADPFLPAPPPPNLTTTLANMVGFAAADESAGIDVWICWDELDDDDDDDCSDGDGSEEEEEVVPSQHGLRKSSLCI